MFDNLIFWCEFPESVDWKKAERLLKGVDCEIYVAVKSVKEYKEYKRKTKLRVYPWPVLTREEGYWFSGFTSRKGIDKLRQYKGLKMKIDLEPPLPNWKYSNLRMILYGLEMIFRKGKNNEYLGKVIKEVAGKGSGLVMKNATLLNEFPFPLWYLKRQGIYMELGDGMGKNYMCYTSFAGGFFRPLVRMYLKIFMSMAVNKNENVSFSIGLIGGGILGREGIYNNVEEFRQDLELVKNSGCRNIAVYSLDGILKREKPDEWVDAVKSFAGRKIYK